MLFILIVLMSTSAIIIGLITVAASDREEVFRGVVLDHSLKIICALAAITVVINVIGAKYIVELIVLRGQSGIAFMTLALILVMDLILIMTCKKIWYAKRDNQIIQAAEKQIGVGEDTDRLSQCIKAVREADERNNFGLFESMVKELISQLVRIKIKDTSVRKLLSSRFDGASTIYESYTESLDKLVGAIVQGVEQAMKALELFDIEDYNKARGKHTSESTMNERKMILERYNNILKVLLDNNEKLLSKYTVIAIEVTHSKSGKERIGSSIGEIDTLIAELSYYD